MTKVSRTNSEEKLIARWEKKLERLGLGILEPLDSSEHIRLHPRKVDKCKWYEIPDDAEVSAYRECIQRALKKLSYRERHIVLLHDGIGDDIYCYTLAEIGCIFKITQARVRQIYEKAIRKLSDHITCDVVNNRISL